MGHRGGARQGRSRLGTGAAVTLLTDVDKNAAGTAGLKAHRPKGKDRRSHVATAGGGPEPRAWDGRTREKTEELAERGGGPL